MFDSEGNIKQVSCHNGKVHTLNFAAGLLTEFFHVKINSKDKQTTGLANVSYQLHIIELLHLLHKLFISANEQINVPVLLNCVDMITPTLLEILLNNSKEKFLIESFN